MKRDWDLIREILTKVEECNPNVKGVQPSDFSIDAHTAVAYHVKLLIDAGLVEGEMTPSMHFDVESLTWEGHEFLDSIRDDTVWEKTKTIFADKGISMSIDLVKGVASKAALSILT